MISLIGPPGCGKSKLIEGLRHHGYRPLSISQAIRDTPGLPPSWRVKIKECQEDGFLVPDHIMSLVFNWALNEERQKRGLNGLVIDGATRKIIHAEQVLYLCGADDQHVVNAFIDLDPLICRERIIERLASDRREGRARLDDSSETSIANRFVEYGVHTLPTVDFLRDSGTLHARSCRFITIPGTYDPAQKLSHLLAEMGLEDLQVNAHSADRNSKKVAA